MSHNNMNTQRLHQTPEGVLCSLAGHPGLVSANGANEHEEPTDLMSSTQQFLDLVLVTVCQHNVFTVEGVQLEHPTWYPRYVMLNKHYFLLLLISKTI